MEQLPWFVWIIFAGMAFGLTMAVISTITEHKQKIAALSAGAEGDLEVTRSTPWRPLWQGLLYAGTGLTALIAIPWRARTRSAEELHA